MVRHVFIIIKYCYVRYFNFYSDIDECVEGLDECDHYCNDTFGSYFCTCMDGYELESDHHTCTGKHYTRIL